MGISALMKLAGRFASRNHMYLFAWMCAVVLPATLQVLAGVHEDTRNYLGTYYGSISLYMFFVMTYSFGIVFISYYTISGLRRAGTLDVLRISRVQPYEVVAGLFLVMQRVLLPPMLVFLLGFIAYARFFVEEDFFANEPLSLLLGMGLVIMLHEIIITGIVSLGLFRNEATWALLAAITSLVLVILPLVFIWILEWPVWTYGALVVGTACVLWGAAILRVAALWKAQVLPPRDG